MQKPKIYLSEDNAMWIQFMRILAQVFYHVMMNAIIAVSTEKFKAIVRFKPAHEQL